MLRRITEIIFSFMLIITFTGCSNSIQESTISKEESTQIPSLPYEKPLDESDSTDKVLLDNGDSVGPLYKSKYYDVINSAEYSYTFQAGNSTFSVFHKDVNYYINVSSDEYKYTILLRDKNFYVISKQDKTATLVSMDKSDLDGFLNTHKFTELNYVGNGKEEYKGKLCDTERYTYKNAKDYLYFYFVDNNTIVVKDTISEAVFSEVSASVDDSIFEIPDNYRVIELPKEDIIP